jgi:hypothetical protein
MNKTSRIEKAREIIARLQLGMNRPLVAKSNRIGLIEATPFLPMPMIMASNRYKRTSSARSY